jgi:hypothetical protein
MKLQKRTISKGFLSIKNQKIFFSKRGALNFETYFLAPGNFAHHGAYLDEGGRGWQEGR